MSLTYSQKDVEDIEHRLIAAEQEIRALRITLQLMTRCQCPVGFGAQSDPNCPKHGTHGTKDSIE